MSTPEPHSQDRAQGLLQSPSQDPERRQESHARSSHGRSSHAMVTGAGAPSVTSGVLGHAGRVLGFLLLVVASLMELMAWAHWLAPISDALQSVLDLQALFSSELSSLASIHGGLYWHLGGACLQTLALYLMLPARLQQRFSSGLTVWLALLCLLLPLIGGVGLGLFVIPGLARARPPAEVRWRRISAPDFPEQAPTSLNVDSQVLREGLASVLEQSGNVRQRQQALMQARHLPRARAVALMRQGVGDEVDEVRLLAYSMLSNLEDDLMAQLAELEQERAQRPDPEGRIAETTAQLYAEFGLIGLAQGGSLDVLLDKGLVALDDALSRKETASRWALRAQLCLLKGQLGEAREGLDAARRLGISPISLAEIEGELALRQRHLPDIRQLFTSLKTRDCVPVSLLKPMEYWQ
ncbi:hypothetical protein CDPAHKCJ_01073 [Cobetia sp. MB87]|nr:hypothetical protein [Cobetia sp. MB87]